MTIKGLRSIARSHNGVGAFILQCKKMDFHYCDWAGSSKGMNGFIKSLLPKVAASNPQVEFAVSPRPGRHPVIIGHYINGRTKPICVRNLSPYEILQKVELLRDASGNKNRRTSKAVVSTKPSVRGIWSPYHGKGMVV
ncbi:mitochondrial ribosomal protein L43, putative [Cordyceps militaris CM01]|uniref:Large ribosomal subunit protein mL43 n=2 Tax=Cordyceps militaris TaxID=73501 RepID=G3J6I8_CORMM|nr:mitochondrial ribosomal protein L43, putative [Cordyceps militaris CM01]ATY64491.1 mitochondrial ribosomal [Cordyceps militaris]EGX97016.1 mitochondrial ribosomal protein L43, putative [Cordyceps militaris CM01]